MLFFIFLILLSHVEPPSLLDRDQFFKGFLQQFDIGNQNEVELNHIFLITSCFYLIKNIFFIQSQIITKWRKANQPLKFVFHHLHAPGIKLLFTILLARFLLGTETLNDYLVLNLWSFLLNPVNSEEHCMFFDQVDKFSLLLNQVDGLNCLLL